MPIPESEYIWFDGELVPWKDARIHVLSHVVHYGSSVFEGIRCYSTPNGPAVFRLEPHLRRMYDSCRVYRMTIPYTREQLGQAILAHGDVRITTADGSKVLANAEDGFLSVEHNTVQIVAGRAALA